MTPRAADQERLAASLTLLTPVADRVVEDFYTTLFEAYPHLRPMFPPDMGPQRDKLLRAILALVEHYDRPEQLTPALVAMGRRHAGYGVRIDHYAAVGAALLATLEAAAGPAWTPDVAGAWQRAYEYAAGVMLAAASGAEPATRPA